MIIGVLAFAWLLGVAAAAFTAADPWAALAAAAALSAASFALRPRPSTLALIALGAALIFAAAWRYDSTALPDEPIGVAQFNDGDDVRFRALVADEPDPQGATVRYRLAAREVYEDGRWLPTSGGVLMRSTPFPKYQYGDLLELDGELETPPSFDGFDYRRYLSRRGIGSLIAYPEVRRIDAGRGSALRHTIIDTRTRLFDALAQALPEPEASLAGGILLGKRARLPPNLTNDMNATGTSHLTAVSGQNVTLVAGMVIAALAWLVGRRPAAWLALAAVVGYSLLVGGEPSVIRAAIMGGLYVVAAALGRQHTAPFALLLAAGVMTAIDPQVAHDVSFQLSFAAALGLMALAPTLAQRARAWTQRRPALHDFPLTHPAVEMASVTVAAIAFTLPVTAINFQRISLVAPLANLLAVPAFLAVAVTAAAAALVGSVIPAAAEPLGWIAWPPAAYMAAVVHLMADLPLASIEVGGLGTAHAIPYYAALALAIWFLERRRPQIDAPPYQAPAPRPALLPASGIAAILVLSSALLWLATTTPVHGRLTVTFLDVGQGDAILVEGPEGHRILVDGGPSDAAITNALGRHLPFHDRRIDLVVLTHPQEDHLGGLPVVLNRYDVRAVLASPVRADTAAYRAWRRAVHAEALPYETAREGNTVDLGGGSRLQVLSAPTDVTDANEGSLVMKLTLGRASFLLTGDIAVDREAALLRSSVDLRSTVHKVAHHGSDSSGAEPFLAAVDPVIDVISVGEGNPFGHPAPGLMERLKGDAVFRTDLHGDVSIATDGRRLWVETAR